MSCCFNNDAVAATQNEDKVVDGIIDAIRREKIRIIKHKISHRMALNINDTEFICLDMDKDELSNLCLFYNHVLIAVAAGDYNFSQDNV
jgi:hypothetical protein